MLIEWPEGESAPTKYSLSALPADAPLARLVETAKMNEIDPQAWLADVLARIADHPVRRLDELLP